jgi:hypothetical protein
VPNSRQDAVAIRRDVVDVPFVLAQSYSSVHPSRDENKVLTDFNIPLFLSYCPRIRSCNAQNLPRDLI